ncbi:MAG: hypothetical protein HY901_29740 [Deltaproteobacteria bacterium]|nr:hypothetical protein [Deltaproteobacteria bacterium]
MSSGPWVAILGLTGVVVSCVVPDVELHEKACDDSHPCLVEYSCVDHRCVPTDLGRPDVGGPTDAAVAAAEDAGIDIGALADGGGPSTPDAADTDAGPGDSRSIEAPDAESFPNDVGGAGVPDAEAFATDVGSSGGMDGGRPECVERGGYCSLSAVGGASLLDAECPAGQCFALVPQPWGSALPSTGTTYDMDHVRENGRPEGPGGSWWPLNPNAPDLPPAVGIFRQATPLLGLYLSDDPALIRQHAYWFRAAGIDHLLVDWTNLRAQADPENTGAACDPQTREGGFPCYTSGVKAALASLLATYDAIREFEPPRVLVAIRRFGENDAAATLIADEVHTLVQNHPSRFLMHADGTASADKALLLVFFDHSNCAWAASAPWADPRFNVKFTNGFLDSVCAGAYVDRFYDPGRSFIKDHLPYWLFVENTKLPNGEYRPIYKRHSPTQRQQMAVWLGLHAGGTAWDSVDQVWGGSDTFEHQLATVGSDVPLFLWVNRFNYYVSWLAEPQEGLTEDKSSSFEPTETLGFERLGRVARAMATLQGRSGTSPGAPNPTLARTAAGLQLTLAASLGELVALRYPLEYAVTTTAEPTPIWQALEISKLTVSVNAASGSPLVVHLRNPWGESQSLAVTAP